MSTKQQMSSLKKNMAVSGICKPVSMIIGYIYVPVALNYLGVERYGVWSTILTILSWISYFDIGIGNGLRNKLTESLSKRDGKSKKLISSAYALTAVIMTVVALIFSVVSAFVNWNRIFGVSATSEDLRTIVILSVIFVALNFILSICKNVFYALQESANVSIMEICVQCINLGGLLIVQNIVKQNLFVMSLIYGTSMTIVNVAASVILYHRHKECKPSIRNVDFNVGKSVVNVGVQFLVIQLCALILFTTDSFIISYFFGAADVTPYSTVNKLFTAIYSFYVALLTPTWSAATKAQSENDTETIRHILKKLYALMVPFFCAAIVLVLCFRYVARIWLGQELEYSNALILFGGLYCILNIWTNMHGCIANGLGILRQQMIMSVLQAVINIPLSLFLANVVGLGTAGILLGTDFSLMFSCAWLPLLIHQKLATN